MLSTRPHSRPPRRRRLLNAVGNTLISVGLLLSLFVAAAYAYGFVEQQRFTQESDLRLKAFEEERAALARERQAFTPTAQVPSTTNSPQTATPLPTSLPSPARRITIPAIGVDSEVVESAIKDGEWVVPKFVVGHLQGSANPKEEGNSVYSGHLKSISSGNVFARIGELRPGNQIILLTTEGQYTYEVTEVKAVANTDLSVVQPTRDATITLITCTGVWDARTRDYLERTVVSGRLHSAALPADPPR